MTAPARVVAQAEPWNHTPRLGHHHCCAKRNEEKRSAVGLLVHCGPADLARVMTFFFLQLRTNKLGEKSKHRKNGLRLGGLGVTVWPHLGRSRRIHSNALIIRAYHHGNQCPFLSCIIEPPLLGEVCGH